MAKKKKQEEHSAGGESGTGRWMLTYLDMITLLFGVFVIMYAMSNVDKHKAEEVAQSLQAAFQGGGFTMFGGPRTGGNTILNDLNPPGTKRKGLSEKIHFILRRDVEKDRVIINEIERGIQISLYDDTFFESGSARLSDEMLRTLNRLAPILNETNHYIIIAGHTDDIPVGRRFVQTREFTDNWELAALRAINVLRYFEGEGVPPEKMSIQSFGKYHPLDLLIHYPNKDAPEMRALNRRVDIIIETGGKYFKKKKSPESD